MVQALGVRLLDKDGKDIEPGGGALEKLARIDDSSVGSTLIFWVQMVQFRSRIVGRELQ